MREPMREQAAVREIVLDTETTGMDPAEGDRLVEIGGVELLNQVPTGRSLHYYINPERDVPAGAVAVHGLTTEFLRDKPVFSQVYLEIMEFIGNDSVLVIHNAAFDMKFINFELKKVGYPSFPMKRVTDTLAIARQKFPGAPASLDALCRRFGIDLSSRELHGALLDAQLLADVYLELMGGRQHGLGLAEEAAAGMDPMGTLVRAARPVRAPRPHAASAGELAAHAAMVGALKDALWPKLQAPAQTGAAKE